MPCPPAGGPDEEAQLIRAGAKVNHDLKLGDTWCLISSDWLEAWRKYTKYKRVGTDSNSSSSEEDDASSSEEIEKSTTLGS